MSSTTTMLTILASVLATALAGPGFVTLPVVRQQVDAPTSSFSLHTFYPDTIQSQVFQYVATFTLGTPGQKYQASIDTGSADLWVYAAGTQGESDTYNASASSTYKYLNSDFSLSYVSGVSARGNYVTDNLTWGDSTVNLQFGVTNTSTAESISVFGIAKGENYPNYPYQLKNSGQIESTAYSLYLDDINASTGTLLFGGVDTSQYLGQLYTVNITTPNSFLVDVEVFGNKTRGVLDSGTTYTYLPDEIVDGLAKVYNVTWDSDNKLYRRDTPYQGDGLTYSFSGAEVTVPASELVIGDGDGYRLSILPASLLGNETILGDSFLRSAYVVYDLDNGEIGIAQSNWNNNGSTILPITSAGIPGAIEAPGF